MKQIDIEAERKEWEHPYRIQVTRTLRSREVGSVIEGLYLQGVSCAVEKRGGMFVVWREPEQEWDVDEASDEWLKEWTSQEPPSWEAFVGEFISEIKQGDDKLSYSEQRRRRNREIYREFKHLKGQGFRLKHIFNLLADKYFLGSQRVRDIVYGERKREREKS